MSDESEADEDASGTDAAEQARLKRKKRIDRIIWSVLGLSMAATVAWRLLASPSSDDPTFNVQCMPKAPRDVTCSFRSDQASAGVCVDLVMICDNREHRINVCSGTLEAEVVRSVDLGDLTPPLSAKPVCTEPRYENERRAD